MRLGLQFMEYFVYVFLITIGEKNLNFDVNSGDNVWIWVIF